MIQIHKKNTFLMKNTSYPAKMSLKLTICQKKGEKKIFFKDLYLKNVWFNTSMNVITKRLKPQ